MPSRPRRSASQKSLASRYQGDLGPLLAKALEVQPESAYHGTHAFHPYPGRFHLALPRLILAETAGKSQLLLDPFMGGGSALVEGMLAGLSAIGNDLNPVSLLVARERTRPRTPEQAGKVLSEAERIAAVVEALRRERHPPRVQRPHLARLAPEYPPHLFAEMLQLIRLIDLLLAGDTRETLRAVFSSLAVKYSNRRSDSSDEPKQVRFPKGAASRFLVSKTRELLEAQLDFGRALPRPRPHIRLLEEDARLLPSLGWGEADLVITSPPYPGVYDYHEHHRLRLDWLDLPGERFQKFELGPRREGAAPRGEVGWSTGMTDVLIALARVLKPGGQMFVVIADWAADGHGVDAAGQTIRLAARQGWRCASQASVQREVFHKAEKAAFAKRGKWEHLLHFRRE